MATEKGRPKAKVDRHHLEYLISLRFTWEEIGVIMDVSSKTLQRRAKVLAPILTFLTQLWMGRLEMVFNNFRPMEK